MNVAAQIEEGLQSVIDQADAIASPENTIPTQEELSAQARIGTQYIGVHKQGKCAVDAREVEDGIAYRLMGAGEDAPWQWMREGDFFTHFTMFSEIKAGMLEAYMNTLQRRTEELDLAIECMGKQSRKRFITEMEILNTNRS